QRARQLDHGVPRDLDPAGVLQPRRRARSRPAAPVRQRRGGRRGIRGDERPMSPPKTKSSSTSAAARAHAIRRARARRLGRQFLLYVGLPTFAAILYYGLWAADEYESVVSFRVQATESRAIEIDGAAGVIPTTTAAPNADAELVREMIRSRSMLERLVNEQGLADHYKQADADWWSRLDE